MFPIHGQFRFSLITIGGGGHQISHIPMAFYLYNPEELDYYLNLLPSNNNLLKESLEKIPKESKLFALSNKDFERLNPNTLTCPVFKTRQDAKIINKIYEVAPILIKKDPKTERVIENNWKINFVRLFDMSNDSAFFYDVDQLKETGASPKNHLAIGGAWVKQEIEYMPLYEGKMIWYYDNRYNSAIFTTGLQGTGESTTLEQHKNPNFSPVPRFWVEKSEVENRVPDNYKKEWFIGFRNISNSTNERTFVTSIIPKLAVGNSMPLILANKEPKECALLMGNLSTIIFDYICRVKIGASLNLNYFYIEQFPVLSLQQYPLRYVERILPKIIELFYTNEDMRPFARDCGLKRDPYIWDTNRREKLIAEIDASYALLYHLARDEVEYILDQFPVLKKNDINKYGDYHTKKLILEAFDRLVTELGGLLNE